MSEQLYHFTSTIQLPWILDAGEIRSGTAGRCEFEGLPGLGLTWVTSNPNGAYSASAFSCSSGYNGRAAYKAGKLWAVRFTVDRANFRQWPEAVADDPAWTENVIKRFNATSKGDNPCDWWTYRGAVDRSKWRSIHVRTYTSSWTEIPLALPVHTTTHKKLPVKTVTFSGYTFQSFLIADDPVRYGWYVLKEQRPGEWVVCD